eukprot:gb/GECG01004468.1/.p1 GENE.gb/GECG01004468.1/~~gb/GECG01004468.1/.p1  ORF type:complete len:292 (+),score=60.22 gb/GECG01004468.1/:1-876(+)
MADASSSTSGGVGGGQAHTNQSSSGGSAGGSANTPTTVEDIQTLASQYKALLKDFQSLSNNLRTAVREIRRLKTEKYALAEHLVRLSTLRARSGTGKPRSKGGAASSAANGSQGGSQSKSTTAASDTTTPTKKSPAKQTGKKRPRQQEKSSDSGKGKGKGASKKGTPPSAFFLFSVYRRPQLMQEDKGLKPSEAATRAGKEWRAMTDEEKRPWNEEYERRKQEMHEKMRQQAAEGADGRTETEGEADNEKVEAAGNQYTPQDHKKPRVTPSPQSTAESNESEGESTAATEY